jgi:hypothetical protein
MQPTRLPAQLHQVGWDAETEKANLRWLQETRHFHPGKTLYPGRAGWPTSMFGAKNPGHRPVPVLRISVATCLVRPVLTAPSGHGSNLNVAQLVKEDESKIKSNSCVGAENGAVKPSWGI